MGPLQPKLNNTIPNDTHDSEENQINLHYNSDDLGYDSDILKNDSGDKLRIDEKKIGTTVEVAQLSASGTKKDAVLRKHNQKAEGEAF